MGLILAATAVCACRWTLLRYTSLLGPPLAVVERHFEDVHPDAEVIALQSRKDPGECAYEVTLLFRYPTRRDDEVFKVEECWEANDEAADDWMAVNESTPVCLSQSELEG